MEADILAPLLGQSAVVLVLIWRMIIADRMIADKDRYLYGDRDTHEENS